jgi:hypothetical protein
MIWKMLNHLSYSPDLSPCDFHLFGPFREVLQGHRFRLDEDVMAAVVQLFKQQPREFFAERTHH